MVGAPQVRVEYGEDILANPSPRLSWSVTDAPNGWMQARVEIRDSDQAVTLSGRDSVFVAWPFAPLVHGETRDVSLRVTGTDGSTSPWSTPLSVQLATAPGGFSVQPVSVTDADVPALLRTELTLRDAPVTARLYATAHGVYQVSIGGVDVDAQILKPGWTPYDLRILYESTDVTGLLSAGANAVGVRLAPGWYGEGYGFHGQIRRVWTGPLEVAVRLEVSYSHGTTETFTTGPGWRGTTQSPITASGIYPGEDYDARLVQAGWDTAGFDDSSWQAVTVGDAITAEPRTAPPVRITGTIGVQEVSTSPSGVTLLDFGQNLVGRLRIRVNGPAGTVVTLRHAEVLEHGELGTRPLREAKATDTYVLSGSGDEEWAPQFTFHGFRYASVEGWPGTFDPASVTAEVIGSDMVRTGWFESSSALLNRFHENVVWGMKGNFLSIPTDCPQRDERMGWTGDIQVFSPAASYLHDCDSFLSSWLRDVWLEQQQRDGIVPAVVPDALRMPARASAAWGDVASIVPYVLYERFGDLATLTAQWPSMVAWTDAVLRDTTDGLWADRQQFGDWLDPAAPPESPGHARTHKDIVATACLIRTLDTMVAAAKVLGKDPARYEAEAVRVREAFQAEYVTPNGRIASDAQTAYAMAIAWNLVPDEKRRARMGERLRELVREGGYIIGTGFVGTPLVCDALTATGYQAAAGKLLLSTRCPGWLYSVTMGATTIWERYDSMLPDGSINPGEMTSFNHYALGAVADWMHRVLAGLAPLEPGYRTVLVAPQPIADLTWVSTRHTSAYGDVAVRWERTEGRLEVDVTVPPNSEAVVRLPGREDERVRSGAHHFEVADPVPVPGPVTPETPLGEIIDDSEAYAVVVRAMSEAGADASALSRLTWSNTGTLGAVPFIIPPNVRPLIEQGWAELSASR